MDRSEQMAVTADVDVERSVEAVIAEYQSPLLRYATRILNDPDAAQDVVQQTFIKLCRHWRNGERPTKQLSSWLYRVTHNNAVDHIRKENRLRLLHRNQAEEVPTMAAASQGRDLEHRDRLQLAMKHLRKLDPSEQQVVLLRLQQGKSYREIAEITRRSEGNVGCILHHAVKKLSKSLGRAGVI